MTYGWLTSTYEWHTDHIQVHTSDIRVACEYIRVTYRSHTSTYEWHTDAIGLHTSDIRITYEWHTDGMPFERKIKLTFLKPFINSLSKYQICKRILGYLPKLKRGLELAFLAHFLLGFLIQMLLIWYSFNESIDKVSKSYLFFSVTKCVIKFFF